MTEQEADERYTARIAVPAQAIVGQNELLIARAGEPDFKPDDELSYCKNGAIMLINRFFEAAACYDEGRVPYWALTEMVETTELLLKTLNGLQDAPLEEIDRVDTAFNEAMAIFSVTTRPASARNPRNEQAVLLKHRRSLSHPSTAGLFSAVEFATMPKNEQVDMHCCRGCVRAVR